MIAVLKNTATETQIQNIVEWIRSVGLDVHISRGEYQTVLGLIGDTAKIDGDLLAGLEVVESVTRISEPFKSANRKFHPDDTVVRVGDTSVGGDVFTFIAGPCSVESEEQLIGIAREVKLGFVQPLLKAHADLLHRAVHQAEINRAGIAVDHGVADEHETPPVRKGRIVTDNTAKSAHKPLSQNCG